MSWHDLIAAAVTAIPPPVTEDGILEKILVVQSIFRKLSRGAVAGIPVVPVALETYPGWADVGVWILNRSGRPVQTLRKRACPVCMRDRVDHADGDYQACCLANRLAAS